MTELQYICIEENMTTMEVYKQIWLLLVTNENIVIKADDPGMLKRRASQLNSSAKSRPGSSAMSLKDGNASSNTVNSNIKIAPLDS